MFVIKNKAIFITFSALLVVASIVFMSTWGLQFGIDFTGGSIMEVEYTGDVPSVEEINGVLSEVVEGTVTAQLSGESGYIVRTPFLDDVAHKSTLEALSFGEYQAQEQRFSSVGPTIGDELKRKAYIAISIVILAIILFIAFVFRHVSKPVSSWKYGIVAIIALAHDILIPTGLFSIMGHYSGAEVDILFVMALLAILGFSVNDTIVVFDRIRENLKNRKAVHTRDEFEKVVGESLEQTYARSLNTSITTFIVLIALYIWGGASTTLFAMTLLVGVIAGTYSSIFLASPLLVLFSGKSSKK